MSPRARKNEPDPSTSGSGGDLVMALVEALDERALQRLAERLSPYLVERQPGPSPLLTPTEAARQLKVHVKTLTRAAREGRVPGARHVGLGWRFDADLLDLLPGETYRIVSPPRTRQRRPPATTPTSEAMRGS